jgi:hypothetical protein
MEFVMSQLTELKVKSLKPQDKPYRVFDEKGLYMEAPG